MDAVEFIKTVNRMYPCDRREALNFAFDNPEQAVVRVERWAKANPVKTRQSEFLKIFPNVKTDDGVIVFCPSNFLPAVKRNAYCGKYESCKECRKNYWLTEVTDND